MTVMKASHSKSLLALCAWLPLLLLASSLIAFLAAPVVASNGREPIIMIPGFASSRLISWKFKDCGAGLNIHIGDRVWLDVAHVLYDSFRENCWVECMKVETYNQTDPPDCKLRAVSSIEAISELDPGQFTGPLSAIFRHIIDALVDNYAYDPTTLAAAPYDWRLPPIKLEERDHYFSNLKTTIEEIVAFNKAPAIVIAHSMGNNVFLYFVEWIKDLYPHDWERWFDCHVSTFFAVGAPLLGAAGTVRVALSGQTFGLPISEASVRDFMSTFGSGPWLFPLPDPAPEGFNRTQAGWPHPPVTLSYRSNPKEPRQYQYEDVQNGTFWEELAAADSSFDSQAYMLRKYYAEAEINPIAEPPPRPPVKNIFAIYGVNEKTELAFDYRQMDEGFRLKKMIWEDSGGEVYSTTSILNKKESISRSPSGKSGDGTVTYNSLAWSHTWHVSNVTTTLLPTLVDMSPRLQGLRRMLGLQRIIYGGERYDSFGPIPEGGSEHDRTHTSVLEFERINHRDVIMSPKLIDLLISELANRTDIPYVPWKQSVAPAANTQLSDMEERLLKSEREREGLEARIRELEGRIARENTSKGGQGTALENGRGEEKERQKTVAVDVGMSGDALPAVGDHLLATEEQMRDEPLARVEADEREAETEGEGGSAIVTAGETEGETEGEAEGEAEEDGGDAGKLVGSNKERSTLEVEDIRDDDEGTEFRKKKDGGVLPDDP